MTVPVLNRPKRLVAGDRVAIVSPSGPVPKDKLDAGLEILRGWGLEVVVMPHALDKHDQFEYLAGSDADRAADLQAAYTDPAVDAVICARGGYGAQRMIELVDWDAMRSAGPKILAGYSDVTALHEAFARHLGLVTLHSPMPAVNPFLSDEASVEHLRATLFEPETVQVLTSDTTQTMVGGRARGVTVGGCLALLAAEIATPTGRRNVAGGILLLEDTDEKAYRLDGFLTHLLRAGWFEDVAGVVLGSWKDCEPAEDLLRDRLGGLGVPIIGELGFGHSDTALTMPLGVPATLDADASTLTLDAPALL